MPIDVSNTANLATMDFGARTADLGDARNIRGLLNTPGRFTLDDGGRLAVINPPARRAHGFIHCLKWLFSSSYRAGERMLDRMEALGRNISFGIRLRQECGVLDATTRPAGIEPGVMERLGEPGVDRTPSTEDLRNAAGIPLPANALAAAGNNPARAAALIAVCAREGLSSQETDAVIGILTSAGNGGFGDFVENDATARAVRALVGTEAPAGGLVGGAILKAYRAMGGKNVEGVENMLKRAVHANRLQAFLEGSAGNAILLGAGLGSWDAMPQPQRDFLWNRMMPMHSVHPAEFKEQAADEALSDAVNVLNKCLRFCGDAQLTQEKTAAVLDMARQILRTNNLDDMAGDTAFLGILHGLTGEPADLAPTERPAFRALGASLKAAGSSEATLKKLEMAARKADIQHAIDRFVGSPRADEIAGGIHPDGMAGMTEPQRGLLMDLLRSRVIRGGQADLSEAALEAAFTKALTVILRPEEAVRQGTDALTRALLASPIDVPALLRACDDAYFACQPLIMGKDQNEASNAMRGALLEAYRRLDGAAQEILKTSIRGNMGLLAGLVRVVGGPALSMGANKLADALPGSRFSERDVFRMLQFGQFLDPLLCAYDDLAGGTAGFDALDTALMNEDPFDNDPGLDQIRRDVNAFVRELGLPADAHPDLVAPDRAQGAQAQA